MLWINLLFAIKWLLNCSKIVIIKCIFQANIKILIKLCVRDENVVTFHLGMFFLRGKCNKNNFWGVDNRTYLLAPRKPEKDLPWLPILTSAIAMDIAMIVYISTLNIGSRSLNGHCGWICTIIRSPTFAE